MTATRDDGFDWLDERLAAAFAARAAIETRTPPDLVAGVLDRLIADHRSGTHNLSVLIGLAAAVVIALVAGVGQLVRTSPAASVEPSLSTGPSATEIGNGIGSALMPGQALAARDAGVGDREMVVRGYFSRPGSIPPLGCPSELDPPNPARLDCSASFTWLMDQPEILRVTTGNQTTGHAPTGPAIQPSLALVGFPKAVADATQAPARPAVTVIGHFHDRRAALCDPARREACGNTFVVDAFVAVDDRPLPPSTFIENTRFDAATGQEVPQQPTDLQEDIDRLVLGAVPGGSILSRQLLTIDRVIGVEPVLAKDDFVPFIGNPATLMWIVTVVDGRTGIPRARTFALFDGSSWFAEVTPDRAKHLERTGSAPQPSPSAPPIPSADPSAFESAPTSVVGIETRNVATVMRDRRADSGDLGRDELAIRAWYVSPDPTVSCEPTSPAIHPPLPPCDGARSWLLDQPDRYGTEGGQVRLDPDHWPTALNPLLPVDVPFHATDTWTDGAPVPQPVVVLGHFEDSRVDTYAGNVYFVIDALAWSRDGGTEPVDTVTRLTTAATEDPGAVIARVAAVSPHAAVATWATVADASKFAALDPRAAERAPEFTSGRPVWIVRRLIANEIDGRRRLAVEWALTADGGIRVWWTDTPDSDFDLATTLDLHDIDPRTTLVRVFDYDQQIVSARDVTPRDELNWRFTVHKYMALLEVARGRTDREVAIRWTMSACDPEWRILVTTRFDGPGVFIQPQTSGDYCPGNLAPRSIMLTFDHPVDLDAVRTTDEASSGGG